MPDKKLTDKEIVKALECCARPLPHCYCGECPAGANGGCAIKTENIIDLINRLQAENERLERVNADLIKIADTRKKANFYLLAQNNELKTAKAEAYKEVEEKLGRTTWYRINQKGELVVGANSETDIPLYKAEDVYNLLKEMVGDNNAKEKE